MKYFFALLIGLFVNAFLFAQKRYFKTANDFKNVSATVYLKSGKKMEGNLSLDYSKTNEEFSFKPEEGSVRTYSVYDISKFEINDKQYVKKIIDTAGTGLKNNEHFVLIISETYSKLVLYQYDYFPSDIKNPPAGASQAVAAKMYFVMVPKIEKEMIISVYSKKLVPQLDVKLSTALMDLLPLATHIAMKDKGYYYEEKTPVTQVVKIWKTIVEEYNASN